MRMEVYRKRLDRIRDGLCLPSDGNDTMMIGTLFDVPDLDGAVSRARNEGATSVMFVPANGGAVQFVKCHQPDHVPLCLVVAFEMAEPVGANINKPFEFLSIEQLRQISEFNV